MSMSLNWDPVYGPWNIASLVVLWTHLLVAVPFYVRRRKTFPICGQRVEIALLGVFALVVDISLVVTVGMNSGKTLHCITVFLSYVLLALALSCYMARAWHLWFEFYAATERIEGSWRHFRLHAHPSNSNSRPLRSESSSDRADTTGTDTGEFESGALTKNHAEEIESGALTKNHAGANAEYGDLVESHKELSEEQRSREPPSANGRHRVIDVEPSDLLENGRHGVVDVEPSDRLENVKLPLSGSLSPIGRSITELKPSLSRSHSPTGYSPNGHSITVLKPSLSGSRSPTGHGITIVTTPLSGNRSLSGQSIAVLTPRLSGGRSPTGHSISIMKPPISGGRSPTGHSISIMKPPISRGRSPTGHSISIMKPPISRGRSPAGHGITEVKPSLSGSRSPTARSFTDVTPQLCGSHSRSNAFNFDTPGGSSLSFPEATLAIAADLDSCESSWHRGSMSQTSDSCSDSTSKRADAPLPDSKHKKHCGCDSSVSLTQTSTWFSSHRHYATTRYLLRFIAMVTLAIVTPSVVAIISQTTYDVVPKHASCSQYAVAGYVLNGMYGLSIIFVVFTIWRLRDVHDGFFIKKHLRNMIAWSVVAIVYSNITTLNIGGRGQLMRVFQYWLTHAFVWETVTLPLYMSYKNESARVMRLRPKFRSQSDVETLRCIPDLLQFLRSGRSTTAGGAPENSDGHRGENTREHTHPDLKELTLRDVLCNLDLLRMFAGHLKQEFSIENLLFYFIAGEFQHICTEHGDRFAGMEGRNRYAILIYSQFIHPGGFYQVNLDGATLDSITKILEHHMPGLDMNSVCDFDNICAYEAAAGHTEVSATAFECARRKIFHLMESDSFVRFVANLPIEKRYRNAHCAKEHGDNPRAFNNKVLAMV